ncbi:MAG: M23 family metallopeptidase [Leptolyngbyaceae cyanobacterium SM1_1_3]|nr:M23 family metallopeptidase [Leptolyngbyaceae cyanobacterium SM1_1_3]NJN02755.1 M23 family metallopeptidase [Leptolyngbyaceae cyanobacterium RM1_1_2]NJO09304.1 M23 family metallopeptidase [Leptolyngbyaceae cyanobacterium SL_1_1]
MVTAVSAAEIDTPLCPPPVLERVIRHRLAAGETLERIAQRYNLLPATLLGLNPNLRQGRLPIGTDILVPPFNGIRVQVAPGQTWQEVAATYSVRADVLFEANGCQAQVPETIFIPGINWFPELSATNLGPASGRDRILSGYPLPSQADVVANYGWQPDPEREKLVFNNGITLAAAPQTPVLAVGNGVVAFVGQQVGYGNLVVINHSQGLQTRYAHLDTFLVSVGEQIQPGSEIATIAAAGAANETSYLYFEVRLNSQSGWVAQDPSRYLSLVNLR